MAMAGYYDRDKPSSSSKSYPSQGYSNRRPSYDDPRYTYRAGDSRDSRNQGGRGFREYGKDSRGSYLHQKRDHRDRGFGDAVLERGGYDSGFNHSVRRPAFGANDRKTFKENRNTDNTSGSLMADTVDKWTHDMFDRQHSRRARSNSPPSSNSYYPNRDSRDGRGFSDRDRDRDTRKEFFGQKVDIENLHWKVTESDLKDLFGEYNHQSVAIRYDKTDRSTGQATVVFATREDAQAAIDRYNNVELDGLPMKLKLHEYIPPSQSYSSGYRGGFRRGGMVGIGGGVWARTGFRGIYGGRRYDDRPYTRGGGYGGRRGRGGYGRGENGRDFDERDRARDKEGMADRLDKEMEEYMRNVEKTQTGPQADIPSSTQPSEVEAIQTAGEHGDSMIDSNVPIAELENQNQNVIISNAATEGIQVGADVEAMALD